MRIGAVVIKEWREILRDRIYFFLAFLLPIVMMLVFGYGMTQESEDVPFAVVDHDRSALSRQYTYRFIESRYFDFKGYLQSTHQIESFLVSGDIQIAIVISEGFQERLLSGQQTEVQSLLDGVPSNRDCSSAQARKEFQVRTGEKRRTWSSGSRRGEGVCFTCGGGPMTVDEAARQCFGRPPPSLRVAP